jgi:hypothetical protein
MDEEEEYTIRRLCRHVRKCLHCKAFVQTGGNPLCERGARYLKDARSYLYITDGRVFSSVAKERTEVTIPSNYRPFVDMPKPGGLRFVEMQSAISSAKSYEGNWKRSLSISKPLCS